jgi:predicted transglutaminase-like cysteine proteinase
MHGEFIAAAPPGFSAFCREFRRECVGDLGFDPGPENLAGDRLEALSAINRDINRRISPRSDRDMTASVDAWRLPLTGNEQSPQASGDCEDYALEKQRRLNAAGFARANLRLAITVHPELGVHAVLIVRSDRGDLVLDSLTDTVRPWNETGYVFLTRQSIRSDLEWRRISSAHNY